jgi:hypothetical protein
MDFTHAPTLTAPSIVAMAAPVYWRVREGGAERLTALLCIVPEEGSSTLLSPGAHTVLSEKRLRALLGSERGGSAHGILRACAEFMTQRLAAGLPLEEVKPLFRGFEVGATIKVRGFSVEQLLDAAVRSLSAFGSSAELVDEVAIAPNHSTPTTRSFLDRVQRVVAARAPDLSKHFGPTLKLPDGSTEIVVDFARNRHLVQFASLPGSRGQVANMKREYDSKLLGAITARSHVTAMTEPLIVVNVQALRGAGDDEQVRTTAQQTLASFGALAKLHQVDLREADTEEEAAGLLEGLT